MKQLYRKQTKLSIRHKINKKFNSTSAFITDIVQVVPTNLNNCTVQGPSMCVRVAEWIKVFNHMTCVSTKHGIKEHLGTETGSTAAGCASGVS